MFEAFRSDEWEQARAAFSATPLVLATVAGPRRAGLDLADAGDFRCHGDVGRRAGAIRVQVRRARTELIGRRPGGGFAPRRRGVRSHAGFGFSAEQVKEAFVDRLRGGPGARRPGQGPAARCRRRRPAAGNLDALPPGTGIAVSRAPRADDADEADRLFRRLRPSARALRIRSTSRPPRRSTPSCSPRSGERRRRRAARRSPRALRAPAGEAVARTRRRASHCPGGRA